MDITIHASFLGPADQPGTSIVLEPAEQPYGVNRRPD
jgi:hypothetical protein